MALWNTLCNGESSPRYPNQGTLVHWAVWCQHWDIITMAAAGADLTVRGKGSWMNGRTAAEYRMKRRTTRITTMPRSLAERSTLMPTTAVHR